MPKLYIGVDYITYASLRGVIYNKPRLEKNKFKIRFSSIQAMVDKYYWLQCKLEQPKGRYTFLGSVMCENYKLNPDGVLAYFKDNFKSIWKTVRKK